MTNLNYVTLRKGQDNRVLFERMEITPKLKTEAEQEAFRKKLFATQGAIEEALKEKWEAGKDFEVGWDYDYSYSLHGGIYSDRIFCSEYAATVAMALSSVEDSDRWVYHTVCEIEVNPDGKTPAECIECRGEFYITHDTIYIFDFNMPCEFRVILGAKE